MLSAQSCLPFCDCVDCSPPGSSIHGVSQARVLEWVAISFSRGSCPPRDQTASLTSPALAGRFFTDELSGKLESSVAVGSVCEVLSTELALSGLGMGGIALEQKYNMSHKHTCTFSGSHIQFSSVAQSCLFATP